MSAPVVSVVVLTHNRRAHLLECLSSLSVGLEDFDGEVIVVDDASEDGTAHSVSSHFPGARILRFDSPVLPCRALNAALQLTRGRYVIRIDDDNLADPEMVGTLVAILDKNPDVAFCGASSRDESGRPTTNIGTSFEPVLRLSVVGPHQGRGGSNLYDVDLVDNAFVFRRDLVQSVGGFAWCQLFPWSLEDAIPQVLLKRKGYRIVCSTLARTVHRTGHRTPNSLQWFHMARSRIVFVRSVYGFGRVRLLVFSATFLFTHTVEALGRFKSLGVPGRLLWDMLGGLREGLGVKGCNLEHLVRQLSDRK